MQRNLDSKRFGKLELHVLQRLDTLHRQLGSRVFLAPQHAANDDRNIDLQPFRELFVGLRERNEFDLADRVLKGSLSIQFAGPLGLWRP